MSDKFKNKYRSDTVRLQNWDYGSDASYFITVCTIDRIHFFGEIKNGKMELSELGIVVNNLISEMPVQFPFIIVDAFVVMPNHIHMILTIDKNNQFNCRDAINRDPTIALGTKMPTENPGGITGNKNPMLHENLSRVMRWYKGRCTFECRKIHADFSWQGRFYEHIIRDQESYKRITNYINSNPEKWTEDKLYRNE
jgi:putative transposase